MTTPAKGKADYLDLGDWNAQCYQCGHKFKASMLKRHWQGYYVCPDHWEPRQPQDFVRGVPDVQTPPWAQPWPADNFVPVCTPEGQSAEPALALPGCMIPGRVFSYVPGIPGNYPSFCVLESVLCQADFAAAGCATVSLEGEESVVFPEGGAGLLLCENNNFLLQENGGGILLEGN